MHASFTCIGLVYGVATEPAGHTYHMAPVQIPSLMEGGTLWFSDLTVTDSTMLLPAMAFGIFLLTAELGGADGMQGQPPHVIQRFKWTMRVLTVVMVPFAMKLPAVSAF